MEAKFMQVDICFWRLNLRGRVTVSLLHFTLCEPTNNNVIAALKAECTNN